MEKQLEFAKIIALRAGEIMLKYFGMSLDVVIKDDLTPVTVADKEINDLLIEEVEKKFPADSVFGEEKSVMKKSVGVWVCDPVDGTVPYSKGIPLAVFSLAYVVDGVPQVGVIYDPFSGRMYEAVYGRGAFLNDKLIKVSDKKMDYKATMDIEWWPKAEYEIDSVCHKLSLDTGAYVLHIGSVIQAACLVAAGQYEACVFAGTKGKSVDVAAAKLLVQEAGGRVTNLFGEDEKIFCDVKGAIFSNGVVHEEIFGVMRGRV